MIQVILASLVDYKINDVICWSDLIDCIFWISNTSKEWKKFVQNRVTKIRKNLPEAIWKHCPGVKNPADIPSRATDMAQPEKQKIWLEGPKFLLHDEEHWPTTEITKELGYLASEHFTEPINVAAVNYGFGRYIK